MLLLDIPGGAGLQLAHLVLDYNGTLACDGQLKPGVLAQLERLAEQLNIYVITADTHGSAQQACDQAFIHLQVIAKQQQDQQKQAFIEQLGASHCIAVGNGINDGLMLKTAALGVALIQEEGCATQTLLASDLVFQQVTDLLDALLQPKRLIATLRNG
ncbi:MAG: HAD family hydrolase [Thiotrichales bacterium]|nr:HAD family hydrolase [Thiotrichales bacterium]